MAHIHCFAQKIKCNCEKKYQDLPTRLMSLFLEVPRCAEASQATTTPLSITVYNSFINFFFFPKFLFPKRVIDYKGIPLLIDYNNIPLHTKQ